MKPNFFNYATNELSQDAFFCWLIKWSLEKNKYENNELHKAGLNFLKHIMHSEFAENFIVKSCEISMQKKNMDFIVELNESIIIHFEDKIKSNTTNNQLSKYKEILKKDYPNHKVYHIYLKADLVWPNENKIVSENGYTLIDLLTIGQILNGVTSSDIYSNYSLKIQQRINEYAKYKIISPKVWSYNQWIGFVYDLSLNINYWNFGKHYLGEDFWFVFSWYRINDFKDSHVSFEIINKKCAIKAHVYDQTTKKTEFLNYIKKLLIPKYKDFKTKNYRRIGKSMLVIEFFDFIVLENGNIDFEKTKQKLLRIKEVFDKTINNVG